MTYNFLSDKEIEQALLHVRFSREIKHLYQDMDQGDFFNDLEEAFGGQDSFLITILTDMTETKEDLLKKLMVSDILDLHETMKEDRIFKRIIKMLEEKELEWELRINTLTDRLIKGEILQLVIHKMNKDA